MPVYTFVCERCGAAADELRRLGELTPGNCPECGGPRRQRFGRVAVRYGSWGFRATDTLVRDPGGTDFRALRERAERIADE
jgi:putative FmdB family regulatory protein